MNFVGLSCSPLDELCGSSNQEAQKGDKDFQVNNGDTLKWLSRGHNVTSEKIDGLVFTMNAAKDHAQDLAARFGELDKSSRHICTSLAKLELVLNTDSSGKLGQPNKLLRPQKHHDSATCKGIHKNLTSQTRDKIPNRNVKPSNDPNDFSDDKTKIFPLIDSMDSFKDVATRSYELKKSSPFIFNSLVKLESAHNAQTSRKNRQHARLFWPQNDLKSVTSKGIQKSTPSRTHGQILNKRAKLSIDPNDFSDVDDNANLFDSDSKGIKPLNDYLHSNSMQMMKCKIDTRIIQIKWRFAQATTRHKIINIMALKTTLMQLHPITDQIVWSLPSSLAIYLPIKDGGHWYLVVVSLEERIVHHLDSCLHVGQVRHRHDFIRTTVVSLR